MDSGAGVVSLEGLVAAVTMSEEYRLLCVRTETLVKTVREERGGVGGSQKREEIQALVPNPTGF